MTNADKKIKNQATQIILHAQEIKPGTPVKINWYVITKGLAAGVIKGVWGEEDSYKTFEEKYADLMPDLLPMDGQWRDVDRFTLLNEKLQNNLYHGIEAPWYDRRGNAFIILPYYDDEGNVK